jgi:hypothetical protein
MDGSSADIMQVYSLNVKIINRRDNADHQTTICKTVLSRRLQGPDRAFLKQYTVPKEPAVAAGGIVPTPVGLPGL